MPLGGSAGGNASESDRWESYYCGHPTPLLSICLEGLSLHFTPKNSEKVREPVDLFDSDCGAPFFFPFLKASIYGMYLFICSISPSSH